VRVILVEDVDNLGEAGDLVEVADGYARNYLLPQQLAQQATAQNIARWEQRQEKRRQKRQRIRQRAEKRAAQLEDAAITVAARAGEQGKLFGSVTAQDIADALAEKYGLQVDATEIQLDEPLSSLGEYELAIRLHRDISAGVKVEVVAEED